MEPVIGRNEGWGCLICDGKLFCLFIAEEQGLPFRFELPD